MRKIKLKTYGNPTFSPDTKHYKRAGLFESYTLHFHFQEKINSMNRTYELDLEEEEGGISLGKFWKLADDLFYTKVFYDESNDDYFTKKFKKSVTLDSAVAKTLRDFRSSGCSILSDDDDELDECSEDEINTLLVSFLSLVSKYADDLIASGVDETQFYTSVATYLLDYKYYQLHVDFCIRKMLSLLAFTVKTNLHNLQLDVEALSVEIKNEVNDNINLNECFIKTIGYTFYQHYSNFRDELVASLKEYHGFQILWKVIENYCAITNVIDSGGDPFGKDYKNYIIILFDICCDNQFTMEELSAVDAETIAKLFQMLKVVTKSEDELNYWKFKLVLVLNEQFIGCFGTRDFSTTNKVFCAILDNLDKQFFPRFFEIVLLNFNRIEDHVDQILIMKFIYLVFLNDKTNRLVYFNDVKIIIDIIIRQLYDLTPSKHEHLMNIFIRVIHLMLLSTQLRVSTYKQGELKEVMNYLEDGEQVMPKTRELARKCLMGKFFTLDNRSDPQLLTRLQPKLGVATNSCPDLTLKLTPPPPPPPRSQSRSLLQRSSTDSSVSSQQSFSRRPAPPPAPQLFSHAPLVTK